MSRSLHTELTARMTHRCDWECGAPIRPGQRYVRAALPPGAEPNEGPRWWISRLHGHVREDCPTYVPYEVDPRVEACERHDLALAWQQVVIA